MRRVRWIAWLALVCAALLWAACSEDEGGVGPQKATLVFVPAETDLIVDAFSDLVLEVRTSLGDSLEATFYVEGDSVAYGKSFRWKADLQGEVELKARGQFDGQEFERVWNAFVSEENAKPTPAVTIASATRGAAAGSVALGWEAPAESRYTIDLSHYVVGYSLSPIPADDFGDAELIQVSHRDAVLQGVDVLGLVEKADYYFRIQTVDVFDRTANLSAELTSESTGSFDVTGRVTRLAPLMSGGFEPMPEVVVELDERKVVTDLDGYYALAGIPDYTRAEMKFSPGLPLEANNYYWLTTAERDTVDQSLDILMVRRDIITVNTGSDVVQYDALDYYALLMGQDTGGSHGIIARWEEYPIPVQVDLPDVDGVSYRQALENGMQIWNDAVGETLMVPVEGAPARGCEVVADLPDGGGGVLGIVFVLDPFRGSLWLDIPNLLQMRLRQAFFEQGIANDVVLHELGHVLLLDHSLDEDHVMFLDVVNDFDPVIHPVEIATVRVLRHMPIGTDLGWYHEPRP